MDLLTYALLGAIISELSLGKRLGNRAALYGAVVGLLPELERLLGLTHGGLTLLLERRGALHSILALALVPLILSFVARGLERKRFPELRKRHWWKMFAWVWLLHLGLDACTTLGIQFFYPFWKYRLSLNMIAPVDPLLTLPLLVFLLLALRLPRDHARRPLFAGLGLALFGLYLTVAFTNRQFMRTMFADACERAGYQVIRHEVYPTWGNNVLWYGVAEEAYGYHIGHYSLLQGLDGYIKLTFLPKTHGLPQENFSLYLEDRLQEATHRYYNLEQSGDTLIWHDLRWGLSNLDEQHEFKKPEPRVSYQLLLRDDGRPAWIGPQQPAPVWQRNWPVFFERLRGQPAPFSASAQP